MKKSSCKAFSLAELMVVMLILTIILAATMPILSKRAKVKAAAAATASSGTVRACTKKITTEPFSKQITPDIIFMSYTLTGGGSGGKSDNSYSNGSTGGSSLIFFNDKVLDCALGGRSASTSNPSGQTVQGFISQNSLLTNPTLEIYIGGGGGGGGYGFYNDGSSWSTIYDGYGGYSILASNYTCSNVIGLTTSPGLNKTQAITPSAARVPSVPIGGGGGGFGGKGGNGGKTDSSTHKISITAAMAGNSEPSTGDGSGGNNETSTTVATGGQGGSATLMYLTTASSCPW